MLNPRSPEEHHGHHAVPQHPGRHSGDRGNLQYRHRARRRLSAAVRDAARHRHDDGGHEQQLDVRDPHPHRRQGDGAREGHAVREGPQRGRRDQPAQAGEVVEALHRSGQEGLDQARRSVHEHPQGRLAVPGLVAERPQDLQLQDHPSWPRRSSQDDRQGHEGQLRQRGHRDRDPRSETQEADQAGRRVQDG